MKPSQVKKALIVVGLLAGLTMGTVSAYLFKASEINAALCGSERGATIVHALAEMANRLRYEKTAVNWLETCCKEGVTTSCTHPLLRALYEKQELRRVTLQKTIAVPRNMTKDEQAKWEADRQAREKEELEKRNKQWAEKQEKQRQRALERLAQRKKLNPERSYYATTDVAGCILDLSTGDFVCTDSNTFYGFYPGAKLRAVEQLDDWFRVLTKEDYYERWVPAKSLIDAKTASPAVIKKKPFSYYDSPDGTAKWLETSLTEGDLVFLLKRQGKYCQIKADKEYWITCTIVSQNPQDIEEARLLWIKERYKFQEDNPTSDVFYYLEPK